MAYLGRQSAAAALVTGDIPDNSITSAKIVAGTVAASDVAADVATQAELDTVSTVASAALPKAGGAMTGAITTNSTFDGVDVATAVAANTAKVSFTPDAAQVFNDTGADVDFRVEASGKANALFVQGSDGKVGIGTGTPTSPSLGTGSTNTFLEIENTGAAGVVLHATDSSQTAWDIYAAGGKLNIRDNDAIRIQVNSDGKVGIKCVPGSEFEVQHTTHMTAVFDAHASAHNAWVKVANTSDSWMMGCVGTSSHEFAIHNVGDGANRLTISTGGTFAGSGSADISDERLKENIVTITDALTTVNQLTGRTFTWKEEAKLPDQTGTQYGFIAQEVESVISELVWNDSGIRKFYKADDSLVPDAVIKLPEKEEDESDEDFELRKVPDEHVAVVFDSETQEYAKSVISIQLIPILVEAVKELSAKVTALESA